MADMPTVVQVGPYRFTVKIDRAEIDKARVAAEDWCRIGVCRRWDLDLVITPETAPDVQAETLVHEVLHAIWMVVRGPTKGLTEETFIGHLAPTLLDTLRRNPALVAYLIDTGGGA